MSQILQLEGLPVLHKQTLSVDDFRELIDVILERSPEMRGTQEGSGVKKEGSGVEKEGSRVQSIQDIVRPPKIRSIMASW